MRMAEEVDREQERYRAEFEKSVARALWVHKLHVAIWEQQTNGVYDVLSISTWNVTERYQVRPLWGGIGAPNAFHHTWSRNVPRAQLYGEVDRMIDRFLREAKGRRIPNGSVVP
jgi:hypothetical protein